METAPPNTNRHAAAELGEDLSDQARFKISKPPPQIAGAKIRQNGAKWDARPLHSNRLMQVMGLSIPFSQWNTDNLPTFPPRALLERASASLLWILEKCRKLMTLKSLERFCVFSFQPSIWTECSLHFWLIQSIMTRESPKTRRWSIDQSEAKARVVHKPKSSALVFDPSPQFINHFVILFGRALKKPPAPQQRPVATAAPSKQASVKPAVKGISHTKGGKRNDRGRLPEKEARTLWTTASTEGGRSSKTALFLSAQICQQVWAAKLGDEDFWEIQVRKTGHESGPSPVDR
jgi:hypothetical protein